MRWFSLTAYIHNKNHDFIWLRDRKVKGQKIGREEKRGGGGGDKIDFNFPLCCLIRGEKWGNRKLFYFVKKKNKMTEYLAGKNLQLYSY